MYFKNLFPSITILFAICPVIYSSLSLTSNNESLTFSTISVYDGNIDNSTELLNSALKDFEQTTKENREDTNNDDDWHRKQILEELAEVIAGNRSLKSSSDEIKNWFHQRCLRKCSWIFRYDVSELIQQFCMLSWIKKFTTNENNNSKSNELKCPWSFDNLPLKLRFHYLAIRQSGRLCFQKCDEQSIGLSYSMHDYCIEFIRFIWLNYLPQILFTLVILTLIFIACNCSLADSCSCVDIEKVNYFAGEKVSFNYNDDEHKNQYSEIQNIPKDMIDNFMSNIKKNDY
ncbi:hypothetical protein DERP_002106 [Dermatophagoides pteronyssinus]|uniref:Uncharacterized protein n=1 Tax=Dermatophagoides pteronyssinus TaxID=6956 RepID=A0ABQ8JH83_DERPT|nr:hypothetical protein DERP_002106 [Dermatophagoides pteronyssinus]